jgi:hypothetical protein
MELLLNLTWILMVLPGYWLWRRSVSARSARKVTALQCLLALGCVLVLLFPVISATDDLHAMRAEMEESPASKRAVRPAGEKHSPGVNRLQTPAVAAIPDWLPAPEVKSLQVSVSCLSPVTNGFVWHVGRAPPVSFLG